MKRLVKLLVLSAVAMGAAAGCNEKKQEPTTQRQVVKPASMVVVPDSVKGKWKAVKLVVNDKNARRQQAYTLEIGSEFRLPDSEITLTVETFLPHFVMDGTTMTSQSNEPVNPAAQLLIREKGKQIYKGWLFSLYPTTHAFQHPQYGFTLVDFIAG